MSDQTESVFPLDLPSEGIFMWEQPGFPQTDYGVFQFRGPCDVAALQNAFTQAQKEKPTFHAYLTEKQSGLYHQKWWRVQPEPAPLELEDLRDMPEFPEDMEAWVHERMTPVVMRGQDLTRQYAVSFRLILLPRQTQLLVFMFNHVVTDGGGLYDFLRDTFRIYHRETKGRDPDWAGAPGIHAQSKNQKIEAISLFRFFLRAYRTNKDYPHGQASMPASIPEFDSGRRIIRHIITDVKEQSALRARAREAGGSLSDLFMAASKLAIQEFNDSRNASTEILTHGLAVNLRGRVPAAETRSMGNPMSGIVIPTSRSERRDPDSLLRLVAQRRKMMLAEGYDIAMSRLLQSISAHTRILPSRYRHPLMRKFLDWPISFFLTNLGVVWPRMENGRPTGETAITHVGDMELVDVHSSVGPTKNNGLAMILRTFMGKFYCVFVFGLNRINEKDGAIFSRLVMEKARAYL